MSKYRHYTDEEFRNLLQTDPDNLDLVYEASDRFMKSDELFTDNDLEIAKQEGFEEGHSEGYDEGYAEGQRSDDSR